MKPFEGSARALGWLQDTEVPHRSSDQGWSAGVVHPQGWWAPDWKAALKLSLEERRARYETEG